jgi:aryl-alcohol dehydrogenase-like predicted oxidoreductase
MSGIGMKYIEFAGMKLSKIGLGAGRFGTKIQEEDAFFLLDSFLAGGGNVVDTARNYYEWVENGRGVSEKTIGKWMKIRANREKVILVTKGGVSNKGHEWTINLSREKLLAEAKESLDALGTEHVDVYLLHRDEPARPVQEIIETMQEIKSFTEARVVGIANWNIRRIKEANAYAVAQGLEPFMVIQTWWSLAEYTDAMWNDPNTTHMDADTYQYLVEKNLLGMAYTSQCKGFFQKAIAKGIDAIDPALKSRIVTPKNLNKLECIKEFCSKNNVSPTEAVLGYITSNIANGLALVSCSTENQLTDILEHCDYDLPQKMIEGLDVLSL